jgi:hypothetical protein
MQQAAQELLEAPCHAVDQRALDPDYVSKLGKPRDFTSMDVAKGAREVLAESAALAPDSATGAKVCDYKCCFWLLNIMCFVLTRRPLLYSCSLW